MGLAKVQNFSGKCNELIKEQFPEKYPYIYLIVASFFISFSQMFQKLLHDIPSYQLVTIRGIFLILLNLNLVQQSKFDLYPKHKRTQKIIFLRAILGAIAVNCGFMGIQILQLQEFQALWMTSPIWSILVVNLLKVGNNQITMKKIILSIINFVGLIITIEPSYIFGDWASKENYGEQEKEESIYINSSLRIFGIILTLVGALCFSIQTTVTILLKGKSDPPILLQYYYFCSVLIGSVFMLAFGMNSGNIFTLRNGLLMLGNALFAYVAQMCFIMGLLVKSSAELLPITYSQIVICFLLDIGVFGFDFDVFKAFGCCIIIWACISIIRAKN